MNKLKKATDRARKEGACGVNSIIQESNTPRSRLKSDENIVGSLRRDVQVTYSTTKVQPVEHRILEKNKIFTVSHNNTIADQIKILRIQILNKLEEIGGNSLLVTSANPREGKTFTSINLGVSIAHEIDRTVLLVDADLRNPSKAHYDFAADFFGVDVTKGLADYLLGDFDIPDLLLNPGIQKLTILPAGRHLPNSAELLNSPRMESLVAEMKNRYRDDRIIIFDSSSLSVCTDPVVLSRFVDGILLVVEAEKTSPNHLKRVKELLDGRPIVGITLNKAK
jgi:non-specific protein-tyrosine kinase